MSAGGDRPTAWWLATLRRRAATRPPDDPALAAGVRYGSEAERRAGLKFWNAAYRAEESGLAQAHALAAAVAQRDPELAETLRLYGDEEGWHRQLLVDLLARQGGAVSPMGRVTGLLYRAYARARRPEAILLANLMFETIGSTTYRMAVERVADPTARAMLRILARDESFHVPLNVHLLRRALADCSPLDRLRLRALHQALFVALVALPLASRPKSGAFDRLGTRELAEAYARELARVLSRAPDLGLSPPRLLLALLAVPTPREAPGPLDAMAEAAALAADRGAAT